MPKQTEMQHLSIRFLTTVEYEGQGVTECTAYGISSHDINKPSLGSDVLVFKNSIQSSVFHFVNTISDEQKQFVNLMLI